MKQQVVVELSQSVSHLLRHWTLLILRPLLEVGQQENLKTKEKPVSTDCWVSVFSLYVVFISIYEITKKYLV